MAPDELSGNHGAVGGDEPTDTVGSPTGEGNGAPNHRSEPPWRLRYGRRLNRAYHRRLGYRTHDPTGVDVLAADWDVLVVLDACRVDALAGRLHADDGSGGGQLDAAGGLETRRSRGSHTVEWLWGNFAGRRCHDLVYVTANVQPHLYEDALDCHHVAHAWVDGFDPDRRTVPPRATTDAALEAAARFRRKRLVVHYLQPHYPFRVAPPREQGTVAFWNAVAAGAVDVDRSTLQAWHADNLAWVLPEVERLLMGVTGRAVVTSDHGTALGERVAPVPVREWGHPWGVHATPLTRVPWLAVEADERRPVVAEEPVADGTVDEAAAREQLEALGYI